MKVGKQYMKVGKQYMKVGVISRHSVANYGSLWQAYALQTTIEKIGHEAVYINYTPAGEVGGKLASTLVNVSKWGKNPVTRLAFLMYQYPSFSHTFKTFKGYRAKYLKQTKEYTAVEDLKNDLPDVDVFCTGSDQVWNLLYDNKIDDTYFLNFVPDSKKKIAYASSFGGNSFEGEDIGRYINYLKRYEKLTTREDRGIEILNRMGLNGVQVLDPTLLLTGDEWATLIPNKEKKEEYLLIYQLRPNKEFDNYAEELAKKEGLKLIRISTMLFQVFKTGDFKYLPKAEDFLWYIKNAKCLLTDSFHGTCFAINFGTPFIEILPGRFNARNQSLLRAVGLEDRVLNEYNNFDLYNRSIDFVRVQEKLEEMRKESTKVLEDLMMIK